MLLCRTLHECVDWNFVDFDMQLLIFVALYMSAWIEISKPSNLSPSNLSHSTWVRGLKSLGHFQLRLDPCRTLHECVDWNMPAACDFPVTVVALYMSAWIEIVKFGWWLRRRIVALYMSAWIEIPNYIHYGWNNSVALYMSAWIEISGATPKCLANASHSTWVRGLK